MFSGPIKLPIKGIVTTFSLLCASVMTMATVSVFSQAGIATEGLLTIKNNSVPQNFAAESVSARTLLFTCIGNSPSTQIGVLKPGQSFSQTVTPEEYVIRSFNEIVNYGQGANESYVSSDPGMYQYICQGAIPTNIVATISTISPDFENLVEVSGTTNVTLVGGVVAGTEIPLYQGITANPEGATGVEVKRIDLRSQNNAGSSPVPTPITSLCINGQFDIVDNATTGFYQLPEGSVTIKQPLPFSSQEIFGCNDSTQTQSVINENNVISILYAVVDDQDAFFGIEGGAQLIPTQINTNTPPAQEQPAEATNPLPPIDTVPDPTTTSGTVQTPAQFDIQGAEQTNSVVQSNISSQATSNEALIRSGGSAQSIVQFQVTIMTVMLLAGAAMITDSILNA